MKSKIFNFLVSLIGIAIAAFGIVTFVVNTGITIGSATGVARIVQHFFGLSISTTVGIVNVTLLMLGLFVLGKSFFAQTVFCSLVYPVFIGFFENLECIKNIDCDPVVMMISDTIVFKDEIMGKPSDRDDARKMLETIKGTYHFVSTGVALIDLVTGEETVLNDVTKVFCTNYTDDDIEAYLDTDEPYDKAGAYAIQGIFGKHIDHYEGDYENVVGLPFHIIEEYLK